jgi:hypothetical protein
MEILQIVARPLPDSSLARDFAVPAALAAPIDFGQILEEELGEARHRGRDQVTTPTKEQVIAAVEAEIDPSTPERCASNRSR